MIYLFDNPATKYVGCFKGKTFVGFKNQPKSRNKAKFDEDTTIYRIFPLFRFKQLLETNEFVIAKPSSWDDPFDNFVFNSKFRFNNELKESPFKKDYFAQCWTFERESYALWEIYSRDTKGKRIDSVKVSSTPKQLSEMFSSAGINDSCFLGRVEYLLNIEIAKYLDDNRKDLRESMFKPGQPSHISTLLIKRYAYRYEREVRLIYNCMGDRTITQNDTYKIPCNPTKVFNKIIIDPKIDINKVSEIKKYFSKYSFDGRKCGHSKLLERKELIV